MGEKCGNVHAVTTSATMSVTGTAGTGAGPGTRKYSTSERKTAYTGRASRRSQNAWASLTAEAFLAWHRPAAVRPTTPTIPAVPEVTASQIELKILTVSRVAPAIS